MTDVVRWLFVAEVISVAFLPLTVAIFGSLPDCGAAFGKLVGLIAITWAGWWIGFATGNGGSLAVLIPVLLAGGLVSWLLLGREAMSSLRAAHRIIVIEEIIFAVAFVVWSFVRSLNPAINGTEKPMDMMLLQATSHVSVSPPQDLWLAGHGVNYYYFGYLLMATMGKLAGTNVAVTFNLALALIFALAITGTFSIAFNLTKHVGWAVVGPILVILSGNAYALFSQVLHGQNPWNTAGWFYASSRVVGSAGATINEFPMFSLVLGDLHPHLMAIPTVLACIAGGLAVLLGSTSAPRSSNGIADGNLVPVVRIVGVGVLAGSLMATNTWDFPTYMSLLVVCVLLLGSRTKQGAKTVITSLLLIAAAVIAFLPFALGYKSPTSGFGFVSTVTQSGQFMEVFGVFLAIAVTLLVFLAIEAGLATELGTWLRQRDASARSSGRWTLFALVLVIALAAIGLLLGRWTLLLGGAVALAATALIVRRQLSEGADDDAATFALVLTALGALAVGLTDVIYLRDGFDGSYLYRMNTVFKFYYQGWILLGLAGAYGLWRVSSTIWNVDRARSPWAKSVWTATVAGVLLMGLTYTVLGPVSYYGGGPPPALADHGLTGMSWLAASDPDDYAAINWLNRNIRGEPVIVEATGNPYSLFGRVSTFTGLPTLLGWADHENQWRANATIVAERHALVDSIYTNTSQTATLSLLRSAHVSLIYVGPCERYVYAHGPDVCDQTGPTPTVPTPPHALQRFAHFMKTVYSRLGVSIYEMPGVTAIR